MNDVLGAPPNRWGQLMLQTRIKTALIILPPVLLLIAIGGTPLIVLTLVVGWIANFEFYSLLPNTPREHRLQMVVISATVPLGYLFYGWPGFGATVLLGVMLLLILELIHVERTVHEDISLDRLGGSALGFLYTGVLGSALVIVSSARPGGSVLWLLACVVAADTCAYFGGRAIGGAKMAPRISPNKTVAGGISGLLGAVLVAIAVGRGLDWTLGMLELGALGLLIGIAAICGDLAESLVKRIFGVKDSGSLLPGHGGILDRVDALIFAAPILFLLPG